MKTLRLLFMMLLSSFLITYCSREDEEAEDGLVTWGYMQFYQATDLGLGPLNVYVNGVYEGQVAGIDADGPNSTDCSITGFSKKFEKGSYNYRVQNISGSKVWQGTIDVPEYGMCAAIKLVDNGGGTGGGSATNGNVMFWTKSSTIGKITVNFNGQIKQITSYQISGSPTACGVAGFANYNLPAGTYSYTASSESGVQWSGSVNVPTNNGCFLQELAYSGTGGGGSNVGHLTVWSSNSSVSTITVTCGGYTRYITTKYSSQPNCEASGTAVFDLPFGNYTINATAADGTSWNPFPISISTTGQCYIVGLK